MPHSQATQKILPADSGRAFQRIFTTACAGTGSCFWPRLPAAADAPPRLASACPEARQ